MTGELTNTADRRRRRDAVVNRERLLAAAATLVLRDGVGVPMASIASAAGVGVGTLYRHYPTREALLDALTQRAFEIVLRCAAEAGEREEPALASLSWFLDQVIDHRGELVLPLHGGPIPAAPATLLTRAAVHGAIERVLERGRRDGSVRADATTADIVVFGAILCQPLANLPDWRTISQRQKAIFLDGMSGGRPVQADAIVRLSGSRQHRSRVQGVQEEP